MALLELIVTYPGELDSDQRAGLVKLSEYCRRFLRHDDDAIAPLCGTTGAALASTTA